MANYKADLGMKIVCNIIRTAYLSEESGVSKVYISAGINHAKTGGKPYYYSQANVNKLNTAIGSISGKLKRFEIIMDGTEREQVKALCKCVEVSYLFYDLMGKTRSWYSNRVTWTKLRLKQEEIDEIVNTVHQIGSELEDIILNYQDPNSIPDFNNLYLPE